MKNISNKDQTLLQNTVKAFKKHPDISQKANVQKQLKSLSNAGVLDFKLFSLNEKEGKVNVDQDEINKILLNIEKTKYSESHELRDQQGKISLNEMKKRMAIINPNFPLSELNILFQNKNELTSKELYEILNENEITDFDPQNEAMEMLLDDKDQLDINKVNHLMQQLGYGRLDKQDIVILTEILDVNHDQKVDRNDLKDIFNYIKNKQNH